MATKKTKTTRKVSINIYLDLQNMEERGISDALDLINSAKLAEEAKGPIIKCIKKLVGDIGKKISPQKGNDGEPLSRNDAGTPSVSADDSEA